MALVWKNCRFQTNWWLTYLLFPMHPCFSSFSYALDGQLSPSQTPSSSYHFLTLVHLDISSRWLAFLSPGGPASHIFYSYPFHVILENTQRNPDYSAPFGERKSVREVVSIETRQNLGPSQARSDQCSAFPQEENYLPHVSNPKHWDFVVSPLDDESKSLHIALEKKERERLHLVQMNLFAGQE